MSAVAAAVAAERCTVGGLGRSGRLRRRLAGLREPKAHAGRDKQRHEESADPRPGRGDHGAASMPISGLPGKLFPAPPGAAQLRPTQARGASVAKASTSWFDPRRTIAKMPDGDSGKMRVGEREC